MDKSELDVEEGKLGVEDVEIVDLTFIIAQRREMNHVVEDLLFMFGNELTVALDCAESVVEFVKDVQNSLLIGVKGLYAD
ncbi:MAG: hypothetical protein LLG04_05400 [Parachlamydia sp.]|nr:hypothetical protein [Parachlamydia sp.]